MFEGVSVGKKGNGGVNVKSGRGAAVKKHYVGACRTCLALFFRHKTH